MKTILVPTNFSECADNALHYAIHVAQLLDAKLEVIYVVEPDLLLAAMPTATQQVVLSIPDVVFKKMEMVEKELKNYPPLKFECVVKQGFLDERILEFVEKQEPMLVVMGTEGAHDSATSLFGTNTSRLVASKKVPILSVPNGFKSRLEPRTEFVFATDFKDIHDWDVMDMFYVMANKLHATINVFNVKEPGEDQENSEFEKKKFAEMVNYFEGIKIELHHSYKDNVIQAVESFALSHQASLIMMIAHERGWLGDLFHKSVTKEMSLYGHLPFLSLPDAHIELNRSASAGYW